MGTIAYCSREDHAPPMFAACLTRLAQRHPDAQILHIISNDIADARNTAVLQAKGDWIWFIDTDMLFAPTTLERLIAHNVDAVQVLCLKRHPPHIPLVWEHSAVAPNAELVGPPRLVPTKSLGAGGTLYRRYVFEKIPGPWFEGILGLEDTAFAQKLIAAGFSTYVDYATPVRHLTPIAVSPVYVDGRWVVRYEAMNGDRLDIEPQRLVTPQATFVVRDA